MTKEENLFRLEFSKSNFLLVPKEGLSGDQSLWPDEDIAQWCYLFSIEYRPRQNKKDYETDMHLKSIAGQIACQHEADLCNVKMGERALVPSQYKQWIEEIINPANKNFKRAGALPQKGRHLTLTEDIERYGEFRGHSLN